MSKKRSATTLAAAVEMSARAPAEQQRSSNTLSEPLRDGGNHDDTLLLLKDLLGRLRANERERLRRLLAALEADAQHLIAESARAMSDSNSLHQRLGNLLLLIDAGVRHAH